MLFRAKSEKRVLSKAILQRRKLKHSRVTEQSEGLKQLL